MAVVEPTKPDLVMLASTCILACPVAVPLVLHMRSWVRSEVLLASVVLSLVQL